MPPSRREFLAYGSAGLLGAAIPAGAQGPVAQTTHSASRVSVRLASETGLDFYSSRGLSKLFHVEQF